MIKIKIKKWWKNSFEFIPAEDGPRFLVYQSLLISVKLCLSQFKTICFFFGLQTNVWSELLLLQMWSWSIANWTLTPDVLKKGFFPLGQPELCSLERKKTKKLEFVKFCKQKVFSLFYLYVIALWLELVVKTHARQN